MRKIRILLADDHQLVREGLRTLLTRAPDMDVVAEADHGDAAVERALALGPDIAVLDISLPGADGIEAARRITRARPDIRCVMLTMYDDAANVERALRAGAKGYILKDAGIGTLLDALRAVHGGQMWLSPQVSGYGLSGSLAAGDAPGDPLTDREREIVRLLAEGYDSRGIGDLLGLRMKTVQNHRTRIMEKLNVQTTQALVRYAFRSGIAR
ncbi:MAG: response regulator transcription factor [Myxococcales bacterium]|jgi:two-component system response regulator NreC|nr:response regulator transcription factor [Myxococcales bacterium]